MIARFRHVIRTLGPRWLTGGEAGPVLHSIGVLLDAFAERARQGSLARFPSHAPIDALSPMGRDRLIIRGFAEASATYRDRLLGWLDVWQTAGNAQTLMDQIAAFLAPHTLRIRIVTNSGMWWERDEDGNQTNSLASPNNWDWDGAPSTSWSRFWVILYPPTGDTLWSDMTFGDVATWGQTETWGSDNTLAQVETIRAICRRFKPGGTRCMFIVIAFDPASFDPTDPPGDPLPAGDWGTYWAGADPADSTRLDTARYWKGTS